IRRLENERAVAPHDGDRRQRDGHYRPVGCRKPDRSRRRGRRSARLPRAPDCQRPQTVPRDGPPARELDCRSVRRAVRQGSGRLAQAARQNKGPCAVQRRSRGVMGGDQGARGMSIQPDRFVHDRLPPRSQWPQLVYDRPEFQFPAQLNVIEELLDKAQAKGFGARPLLRSSRTVLSYADVRQRIDRICRALVEDLGLVPGNRVLLRGGNSIGLALAWLAVVKAGMVAVATMPLLRARELGDIIDKAQPTVAMCDAKLLEELELACKERPLLATVLAFNAENEPGSMDARAAQKDGGFAPCPTAADDIAMMAFTSGTTGKPKAAVHTHRDVLAACEAWPRHVLRASPDDIVVGSPPLAFTFGLGGLLLFPMWAGASVYFPDAPYTPDSAIRMIREIGATICYTAPTFYRQMAPLAREYGVGRLRICVSAGEGLPDATRQLWKQATGIEMLDGI